MVAASSVEYTRRVVRPVVTKEEGNIVYVDFGNRPPPPVNPFSIYIRFVFFWWGFAWR